MSTNFILQSREEREEIAKELRAQREGLEAMTNLSPSGSNIDNNNGNDPSRDLSRTSLPLVKDPPPLGLAGLEAFRREYLTSPLSHLRGGHSLLPPFPPLGIPHSTAAALQLAAEGGFGKLPGAPPSGRGLDERAHSRGATPPASTHSTPTSGSEFSSQQNWSFEEQFKQVSCFFRIVHIWT